MCDPAIPNHPDSVVMGRGAMATVYTMGPDYYFCCNKCGNCGKLTNRVLATEEAIDHVRQHHKEA